MLRKWTSPGGSVGAGAGAGAGSGWVYGHPSAGQGGLSSYGAFIGQG